MRKPELLAPAGNLEKLEAALHYGADAVYLSGKRFGLRAAAGNFELSDIKEGVRLTHRQGAKVYVTVNIFFHNRDLEGLEDYLHFLYQSQVDALIISDPGVVALARKTVPDMELHLSTQANTTNWRSVRFWQEMGVQRVNLARELTLTEIGEIRKKTDLSLEAFVHGAVCMAYSGRCHLSAHMTGRDANYGECTHSCRWEYTVQEKKRPGETFEIEEDVGGTYFFNSKDLCMIEHIPALIDAGIDSLKIEGRVKGVNYVASAVRSYRLAIDSYFRDPATYRFNPAWLEELRKLSHREYDTGFYLGEARLAVSSTDYIRDYQFVGIVREVRGGGYLLVEARNKIVLGDVLEVMGRREDIAAIEIDLMLSPEGIKITHAQPGQFFLIKTETPIESLDILRKEKQNGGKGD